jgi:hypothetical protein
MLERSRICGGFSGLLGAVLACAAVGLAGCAVTEPVEPAAAAPPAPSKVVDAPPAPDPRAIGQQAAALLAQAETDIHRARARRALWSKAWESLVGARAALAAADHPGAIRLSRRASELAQLGLEQVAYPAVTLNATRSPP